MHSRTPHLDQPRGLRAVAYAAFAVTVPSAVWRVLMIVGALPGTAELRAYELGTDHAVGYLYVFGLSLVQLATAYLVVGLTRPWSVRLRGRRVPFAVPLVGGLLGGLAVTWLFDVSMLRALLAGVRPDQGLVGGTPLAVMVTCYAPIVLWGPLTLVATLGYAAWRRRSGRSLEVEQQLVEQRR